MSAEGDTIYSMNCICLGLIGNAAVSAEAFRFLGGVRYDVSAVWNVLKGCQSRYKLDITQKNGTKFSLDETFVGCIVNQTQYFGKNLRATPAALLDDELFDVILIKPARRSKLLQLFTILPSGQHVRDSVCRVMQATAMELHLEQPGVGCVDGELIQHKGHFKLAIRPSAVRLLI